MKIGSRICTIIAKILLKSCGHSLMFEPPYKVSWKKIEIGNRVHIGCFARLEASSENAQLEIHDDVSIEQNSHIIFGSNLEIGKGTMISSNVLVTDTNHIFMKGTAPKYNGLKITKTSIGENCFLGAGCKILAGCIMEDDVIIGSNAVVLNGRYTSGTYVGNPAKKIV